MGIEELKKKIKIKKGRGRERERERWSGENEAGLLFVKKGRMGREFVLVVEVVVGLYGENQGC